MWQPDNANGSSFWGFGVNGVGGAGLGYNLGGGGWDR
jgi:hypothetical protein